MKDSTLDLYQQAHKWENETKADIKGRKMAKKLKSKESLKIAEGDIQAELKGWICPKCGSVYSPYVSECLRCGSPFIVFTDTGKYSIRTAE